MMSLHMMSFCGIGMGTDPRDGTGYDRMDIMVATAH